MNLRPRGARPLSACARAPRWRCGSRWRTSPGTRAASPLHRSRASGLQSRPHAGTAEDAPIVVELVYEFEAHAAQQEAVDLRVDVYAPADGPIDGGGRLDDLDLLPCVQVLAPELLRKGEAVEPLVGDLVRGPGGDVADLLRLVACLLERLGHAEQPLKGRRRLLELRASLDDLGSDHVSASVAGRAILGDSRSLAGAPPYDLRSMRRIASLAKEMLGRILRAYS